MEQVPKESETIAAKRSERLNQKIHRARQAIQFQKAWWSKGPIEIAAVVIIFGLCFYAVNPLFGQPAPDIPFSGPVIPFMAKAIGLTGLDFYYSLQIVYLIFFLFFVLSFYHFVRKVCERKLMAFLSTLFVILPIYPFLEARVSAGFFSGDGPHIASLALVPLAMTSLLAFLQKGGFNNLVWSAIFAASVVLVSPFGFLMYLILAFITTFSEMLLGEARLKFARALSILIIVTGLTSFWYNPQFIFGLVFGPLGSEIRATTWRLLPMSFFSLPVLAAFGFLLFDRKPNLQPLFLSSFYTIAFALITAAGGGFFLSHPSRYVPEFGISLAFLLGVVTVKLLDRLRESKLKAFKFMTDFNRNLFVNAVVLVIALAASVAIVLGSSRLFYSETDVLGIWTGVQQGDIWLARQNVSPVSSALGYTITGSTLGAFGMITYRQRKGIKKR